MKAMRGDGEVAELRARFALERVSDGGVLVDLETGGYFQHNTSAAEVCATLLASTSIETAVGELAARLGVPRDEAARAIESIRADLAQPVAVNEIPGPLRYNADSAGYHLDDEGRSVLIVDPVSSTMRLAIPSRELRYAPIDYVRTVTPKLLGLLGITVLHASACRVHGRVVGFSGRSGAGKTTTARAFVSAGAAPISEDLLVLAGDGADPVFWLDGEAVAHAWAEDAARALASDAPVSFATLSEARMGNQARLDELWFLASERREGQALHRRVLRPAEGLLALLPNTFLGVADGASWRRHARVVRDLSEKVRLVEATPPLGLEGLLEAARSYTTNSAS